MIWLLAYICGALALGFSGQLLGIPQDALDAQKHLKSPILNGLNFQSRIDIKLWPIGNVLQPVCIPVLQQYNFVVNGLNTGEYELHINSYDFMLQNERYHVTVGDTIEVYEQNLASKFNQSLVQVVTLDQPLVVHVTGYKEYYESPKGKITDMVMNSPFGFIFKNRLYTTLFVASVVIMALPYVLPVISPEWAEEFKAIQEQQSGKIRAQPETIAKIPSPAPMLQTKAQKRR